MSEKKVCEECNTIVDMDEIICPNCCGSMFRIISENDGKDDVSLDFDDFDENDLFEDIDKLEKDNLKDGSEKIENITLDDSMFYRGQSTYEQMINRMDSSSNKKSNGVIFKSNSKVVSCLVGILVAAMGFVAKNAGTLKAFSKGYRAASKFSNMVEESKKNNNSYKSSRITSEIKGELVNGVYRNNWLGVQLMVPQSYSKAPDSLYNEEEGHNYACGLYIIDSIGNAIIADFADLSNVNRSYTAKQYIDDLIKEANETPNQCSTIGTERIDIAGKSYEAVHFNVNNNGSTHTESFYAYKKEEVLVVFIIVNSTNRTEYCNSLVRLFKENNLGM